MGPLASAEFVRTIYEHNLASREQEMPACILLSDPSIPDRTEAIGSGTEQEVVAALEQGLTCLSRCEVGPMVIPCITAHHFLPKIDAGLRFRVVSLIDVIVNDVAKAQQPHLLFCTSGTRRAGIFEQSPRWSQIKAHVVLPSDADQERIHQDLLYRVKQGDTSEELLGLIKELLAKYQVQRLSPAAPRCTC
jgi:aspartate racemase